MKGQAVVVVGKGPAVVTTPEQARELARHFLRADEPYRTWAEVAAS